MKKCLCLIITLVMLCCFVAGCKKEKPNNFLDDVAPNSNYAIDNRYIDKVIKIPTFTIDKSVFETTNDALKFNPLFCEGMVIQRGTVNCIYGSASASNVAIIFDNNEYYGKVKNGRWEVYLPPLKADKITHKLIVYTENEKLTLNEIYIGEVFICAGQSNMATTLGDYPLHNDDILNANDNLLRIFNVRRVYNNETKEEKVDDFIGDGNMTWQPANSSYVRYFSAVGYIFGKQMRKALDMPIGLIGVAIGGTSISYWLPETAMENLIKNNIDADPYLNNRNEGLSYPSNGYNGMVYQLRKLNVRGVIWYQGESDAQSGNASHYYAEALTELMKSWRKDFDCPNMTFSIVELSRYSQSLDAYGDVRSAQQKVVAVKENNACLAINIDLGHWTDIHPPIKTEIASRLAKETLFSFYGVNSDRYPKIVKVEKINDTKIKLTFKNVGDGLKILNDSAGFEIRTTNSNGINFDKKTGYVLTLSKNLKSITIEVSGSLPIKRIRYGVNPLTTEASQADCAKQLSIYNSYNLPLDQFVIEL